MPIYLCSTSYKKNISFIVLYTLEYLKEIIFLLKEVVPALALAEKQTFSRVLKRQAFLDIGAPKFGERGLVSLLK